MDLGLREVEEVSYLSFVKRTLALVCPCLYIWKPEYKRKIILGKSKRRIWQKNVFFFFFWAYLRQVQLLVVWLRNQDLSPSHTSFQNVLYGILLIAVQFSFFIRIRVKFVSVPFQIEQPCPQIEQPCPSLNFWSNITLCIRKVSFCLWPLTELQLKGNFESW